MPGVTIGTRAAAILRRELRHYADEVRAMAEVYRSLAAMAGQAPDASIPEELQQEVEWLGACDRLLSAEGADRLGMPWGIDVPAPMLAIFSTTMDFYREYWRRNLPPLRRVP